MGWREREYARWTDEERNRFLGTSSRSPTRSPSRPSPGSVTSRKHGAGILRPGVGLAVAVSAALVLLGQLPRDRPLLPRLHISLPGLHISLPGLPGLHAHAPSKPSVGKLNTPRTGRLGSFLTFHGELPSGETGTVSVEGAYGAPPWRTLAAVPVPARSYTARIRLSHVGLLHLRIVHPDGHRSVGSIRVRR